MLLDPPWTGDGRPDPAFARERAERLAGLGRAPALPRRDGVVALAADLHPDRHSDDLAPWYAAKRQLRPEAGSGLGLPPWPDTVADIRAATLPVRGETERGGIVSEDLAAQASQMSAQLESRFIPGTGHNPHREDLDATLAAILDFLRH